eukprot:523794-Prorocentrum_minimum.AAC.1
MARIGTHASLSIPPGDPRPGSTGAPHEYLQNRLARAQRCRPWYRHRGGWYRHWGGWYRHLGGWYRHWGGRCRHWGGWYRHWGG